MEAQTIEAVSNLNTVGGQSIVGLLRESRNKIRLQAAGVLLDNNISPVYENEKELLCNGTTSYTINGTTYTTTPSTEAQKIDGVTVTDGVIVTVGVTVNVGVTVTEGVTPAALAILWIVNVGGDVCFI